MKIPVGSKVKFAEEKQRYTVQASDDRFAVCTRPFNLWKTVLYSIIDFKEGVRGPENLVFGMGAETQEQCEDMIERLNGRHEKSYLKALSEATPEEKVNCWIEPTTTEVSHRNRIPLDIEKVVYPSGEEIKL